MNDEILVIGISGKPKSGKTTLAESFVEKLENSRIASLSDQIRKVVCLLTSIENNSLSSHVSKDSSFINEMNITPRELTVKTATAIETVYGRSIWSTMLKRDIDADLEHGIFIVPDLRTHQQARWVRSFENNILIRLDNGVKEIKNSRIENELDDWQDWDLLFNTDKHIFNTYNLQNHTLPCIYKYCIDKK